MPISTVVPRFDQNILQTRPTKTLRQGRKIASSDSVGLAIGASNRTIQSFLMLEAPYSMLRFGFVNDTATPYTVTSMIAGPAASWSDAAGRRPVDKDGNLLSWTTVTFNGEGEDEYPEESTGSAHSLDVPAFSGSGTWIYRMSDWVPVQSTPNTAGNLFGVIMRAYFAADAICTKPGGVIDAYSGNPTNNKGRLAYCYARAGDYTNGATSDADGSGPFCSPQFVQAYSQAPGDLVYAAGDSLTAGSGTGVETPPFYPNGQAPWCHLACADISQGPGRPVGFIAGGYSGQTTSEIYQRAKMEIPLFRPNVVLMPARSTNDGVTRTVFESGFSRMMAFGQFCLDHGATPIYWTQFPNGAQDTAADTIRRELNTRLRTMASYGQILLIDLDLATSDQASPARFIDGYAYDTYHMNDTGNQAAAIPTKAVLRRALGI